MDSDHLDKTVLTVAPSKKTILKNIDAFQILLISNLIFPFCLCVTLIKMFNEQFTFESLLCRKETICHVILLNVDYLSLYIKLLFFTHLQFQDPL